ncbi:MAG: 4-hydroxythreonine-4-phosphate dehydrogenase PdxA [Chloroflexi bacterium]|jgi:4-hydroxythreonine-4-phosphate dehydrogenase|nr:4-hydroxythreonine-4-phosphate dehydrogenase PdxA [Chloroflexota bacterium]
MIAVTMGDGNGVGPEIILKTFVEGKIHNDYVVVGDAAVLQWCNRQLGFGVPLHAIHSVAEARADRLNVLDLGLLTAGDVTPGRISEKVAAASRQYICTATGLALEGQVAAITTLPVNKEAIRLSDPHFTGHTELIAGICGQSNYTMMLASEKLTVTHVSTHVSLAQAIAAVKTERILDVIELTHAALARFLAAPRIAVAGLNPHAGEGGAFGVEDAQEIVPAVEQGQQRGMNVSGPYPPDTIFRRASRGEFDAVVCMYHDQGHIPMKLLDFEGGVNVTLGLKVMRTSVDHGTGFDIAYQNVATNRSYVEAYNYAFKMKA